jgi:hypothetical protein
MLRHAVLIEFTPGTGAAEIARISDRVRELPARVPSVVAAVCGPDTRATPGSSDFAIVVDLADVSDYPDYVAHIAHEELARLLGPHVRGRTVVDFRA